MISSDFRVPFREHHALWESFLPQQNRQSRGGFCSLCKTLPIETPGISLQLICDFCKSVKSEIEAVSIVCLSPASVREKHLIWIYYMKRNDSGDSACATFKLTISLFFLFYSLSILDLKTLWWRTKNRLQDSVFPSTCINPVKLLKILCKITTKLHAFHEYEKQVA